MNSLLRAATQAHDAGLCVIPTREDGSKRPAVKWMPYMHRRSTTAEIETWYKGRRSGMGLVCGEVSGGLELFEFDDAAAYMSFKLAAAKDPSLDALVNRIESGYLEQSPAGFHWVYRCDEVGASRRLCSWERGKPRIETRGEGGFVVVAPSHGRVHPTGKAYELISGGFETIAKISADEREALFDLAYEI